MYIESAKAVLCWLLGCLPQDHHRAQRTALSKHEKIKQDEENKAYNIMRFTELDCMHQLQLVICSPSSSTEKRSSMLSALVSLGESRSFIHITV